MNLGEILNRIEDRLQATGLSADAASKLAKKPDAIRNLRRAVKENRRTGLSTSTVAALAEPLQCSAAWLLTGEEPSAPRRGQAEFNEVRREYLEELFAELFRRIGASAQARADLADAAHQRVWAELFARLATMPQAQDAASSGALAARDQVDSAFVELVRAKPDQ